MFDSTNLQMGTLSVWLGDTVEVWSEVGCERTADGLIEAAVEGGVAHEGLGHRREVLARGVAAADLSEW